MNLNNKKINKKINKYKYIMTLQTVTQKDLDDVVKNLNNNIIGTSQNLQNNQNELQKQIINLDNKIINQNNDIYRQFEYLLNIFTVGKYTFYKEIIYNSKPKIEINADGNIIHDIKNNTITRYLNYTNQVNHPVDKIDKITRETNFYIKDKNIIYESITYDNNKIIVASRLGHVLNITENSFEIKYNGSRTSTSGILDNILIFVEKENTGRIKSTIKNDIFIENCEMIPIK